MNRLFELRSLALFLIIAILIIILFGLVNSDTWNIQSAHEINIVLKPCGVVSDSQFETNDFNQSNPAQICGEVFSEYMPLELEYFVTNLDSNETILYCEHIKITTRVFTIKLPDNLDTGNYKFELKAGCRKHVAETNFLVLH